MNFYLTGGRSQSQVVSIQNINAFLTKNKDLAKALGKYPMHGFFIL